MALHVTTQGTVGDLVIQDEITLTDGTDSHILKAVAETGLGGRLTIGLDETARTMVICDYGDIDTDFALAAASHPTLYIKSAGGADHLFMYHDDTDAYLKWNDGNLALVTDEGTNTNSQIFISGKESGNGLVRIYDQDNEYLQISSYSGIGYITTAGSSPGVLSFQSGTVQNITMWASIASGNPKLTISGYDSNASALDTYSISAAMDAGAGTKLAIGLDETMRTMVICDAGDVDTDFGFVAQPSPTLRIMSAASAWKYVNITSDTWDTNNRYTFTSGAGFQFNLSYDVGAGNVFEFDSDAGDELTDADGEQAFMYIEPKINQTGTAAWNGIHLNATVTGEGDGSTGGVAENTLVALEADSVPLWNVCIEKKAVAHTGALFDASALTDTTTIFTLPANTILMSCVMKLNTQFAGVTTLKVEVGINGGDSDGFLVPGAMDLTADAANSEYSNHGAYWDNAAGTGGFYYADSATTIEAKATATVANLDQTSAGAVTFYFTYMKLVTTT